MSPGEQPPAPPLRWMAWGFERYLRRLSQQHFAAVHWGPGARLPSSTPSQPILFVANHTNWWDGFFAYLVMAQLGLHVHVLMDGQNLDRYWIFKWFGTLPVRRHSAPGARADLAAAAAHLRRPATGMWIFPQGARSPADAAIHPIERGAAHLALSAGRPVTLWPVAFRYRHLGEQRPEAFAWLGEPWEIVPPAAREGPGFRQQRRSLSLEFEAALQRTVAELDRQLATESLARFAVLVPGRLSVNKRLDRLRHALGLLRGPFEPRNG